MLVSNHECIQFVFVWISKVLIATGGQIKTAALILTQLKKPYWMKSLMLALDSLTDSISSSVELFYEYLT